MSKRIFDPEELLDACDGDEAVLLEVFGLFHRDIPVQIEDIRVALEANDAVAAGKAAHKIKGSFQSLRGKNAENLALIMEIAGRADDLAAAKAVWEPLLSAINAYDLTTRQWLSRRQGR